MACIPIMVREIALHKDLKENTKIYHMYKLQYFEYLLKNKLLYLNGIKNWKDPYELPYRVYGPDVVVQNGRINKGNYTDDEFEKIISDPIIADISYNNDALLNHSKAMCFNRKFDKEALWEYYSKDKNGNYGVCVETTVGNFIESVEMNYESLFVGPVQYFDFFKRPKLLLLNEQRKYYPRVLWMGFIKRKEYEYENETRFIFYYGSNNVIKEPTIDINKYINKIILAPDFEKNKDKEKIISDFKEKYNIGSIKVEMSKLYEYKKFVFPDLDEHEKCKIFRSPWIPQKAKTLYVNVKGNFIKINKKKQSNTNLIVSKQSVIGDFSK